MNTIYLDRSDRSADAIIRRTFPGYSGRKVQVRSTESVAFSDTQWSGGSRSDYRILDLASDKLLSIPEAPFMARSALHEASHALPAGFVVAEHSRFCGKDIGIILHVNPATLGRLLPSIQSAEVSHDEKIVLTATRTLRSSYGGVKNLRFVEAKRETGITLERWEAAKQACIDKGLLDTRGAITSAGKNACNGLDLWKLRQAAAERGAA